MRYGRAARPNEALAHLQRKVDNAIRRVGQPQDAHKFTAACDRGAAAHIPNLAN